MQQLIGDSPMNSLSVCLPFNYTITTPALHIGSPDDFSMLPGGAHGG